MGGHADRRAVHYGIVVYYDNVRVRQVFQTIFIYCHCLRAAVLICGRAEPERGQELHQELLRRLLRGCDYRACSLHHLLGVCGVAAHSQPRCGGGHDGMGLYRGIGVQYARPCRCGQDGRPCGKGNDGLVNILYPVDFIARNRYNMGSILLSLI